MVVNGAVCASEVPRECWAVQGYSLLVSHQQRQPYILYASINQVYTFDRIRDVWTLLDILRDYKLCMLVGFCKFNFEGKTDPMCHIYANKVYSKKIKED